MRSKASERSLGLNGNDYSQIVERHVRKKVLRHAIGASDSMLLGHTLSWLDCEEDAMMKSV